MFKIKTYFWQDRIETFPRHELRRLLKRSPNLFFKYGNAGDIFNKIIIPYLYPSVEVENSTYKSNRLFFIGSTMHMARANDVVAGVGIKSPDQLPAAGVNLTIRGVRGHLTYDLLKKNGFNISMIDYMMDPGLLIRKIVDPMSRSAIPNQIGILPHYRERYDIKRELPFENGVKFINIDSNPVDLAKKILECEIVYTSSLHGIVFAHSLERPVVFVRPKTQEPLFKYQDYFSSIGKALPTPKDGFEQEKNINSPISPICVRDVINSFKLMPLKQLQELGCLEV